MCSSSPARARERQPELPGLAGLGLGGQLATQDRHAAFPDGKPGKVTVELPTPLHYAEVLARESGQPDADPVRLIVLMLERFIATDKGFAKARRIAPSG